MAPTDDINVKQRAAAKRTAIVLALVALGVYVAFLLSGMSGALGK